MNGSHRRPATTRVTPALGTAPDPLRRRALLGALSVAATCMTGAARAQGAPYPSRPITLVVPWPAGGVMDALSRSAAEQVAKAIGQNIAVDNRSGATGRIGMQQASRAPADGYLIGLASSATHTIAPAAGLKLPYDPVADFEPIALLAAGPLALVCNPAFPAADVRALVAYAKANPGKLRIATPGIGTVSHLAGELLRQQAGIEVLFVHYRGEAPAATDLIGGQTDVLFVTGGRPLVDSGKVRVLATSWKRPWALYPGVPSIADAGFPDFDVFGWAGLVAPAGTPPEVIARLNAAARTALASEEVQAAYRTRGLEPIGGSPTDMARQIRTETDQWRALIRKANIVIE